MSNVEGFLALALMIAGFWITRRAIVNHFKNKGGYTPGPQILGIVAPVAVSLIVVPMFMILLFGESIPTQPEPKAQPQPQTKEITQPEVSETPAKVRPDTNTEQAVPYHLLSTDDIGFAGRSRMQFNISAPTATTFEQFAHTAIKAAKEYQRSYRQQVVYIFIGDDMEQINNGDAYAIANYAVDGGGNSGDQDWYWQVEAMDPLTDTEKKVLALWDEHSDKFKIEDSWEIDEEAFKQFAAKQLNIEKSNISLRLPSRKPYLNS